MGKGGSWETKDREREKGIFRSGLGPCLLCPCVGCGGGDVRYIDWMLFLLLRKK